MNTAKPHLLCIKYKLHLLIFLKSEVDLKDYPLQNKYNLNKSVPLKSLPKAYKYLQEL